MAKGIRHLLTLQKAKRSALYRRMLAAYLLLLLLPITVMETVNFLSARKAAIQSLDQLFDGEGIKQVGALEEQMEVLDKVIFDARLTSCFYSPFAPGYYPVRVLEVKDYLKSRSPWLSFFSGIYYYNAREKRGISSAGMVSEEVLLGKYLQLGSSVDPGLYLGGERTLLPLYNGSPAGGRVVIAVPVEEDVSCLFFTVDKGRLDTMLSVPGNPEGTSYLFYNDQLVYSSRLGEGSQPVYEAPAPGERSRRISGELFTLEWRLPESVYMAAILKSIGKQSVIVLLVLSAGFLLIRRAMEHNYKPIQEIAGQLAQIFPAGPERPEPENEVQYINRAVEELLYSRQFLEESNQELKKEQLLYQLLCSHIQKGSILYEECMGSGIRVDRNSFMCLYMEEAGGGERETGWYDYLTERLENEMIGLSVYSTYFTENGFIFLISSELPCGELDAFLHKAVRQEEAVKVVFGTAVDSVEKIHDSYQSLLGQEGSGSPADPDIAAAPEGAGSGQSQGQEPGLGSGQGQRQEPGPGPNQGPDQGQEPAYVYPRTSLTALKEAAEGEQLAKMELAVSGIKDMLAKAPAAAAMAIYMEAAGILAGEQPPCEAVLSMLAQEDFHRTMNQNLTQLYKRFRAESVLSSADYTGTEPEGRWKRDIGKILEYIGKNCTDNTFTIKSMAAELGTTPSNLSHYFKKCTGQNISKYIETVKMKQAMELLKGPARVTDVAERLGYNSTAVFIETFKRICGMTPNQYRQDQEKRS